MLGIYAGKFGAAEEKANIFLCCWGSIIYRDILTADLGQYGAIRNIQGDGRKVFGTSIR